MTTLEDLRNAMNQFLTSAIEATYNQWESPKDLEQIKEELVDKLNQYVEEMKDNGN
jgi:L-lactate utilization protein LutB